MPSSSALNDSVRRCCRTRRSCWMSSSISSFNDSGCTTVRSGVVRLLGGSKYTVFEPPGTWYWYCYGLANLQHPTDQYTHQTCRKIHSFMLAFFSVPHTRIFCALLCRSLSLSQLISGVTWHALLSVPHYRACLRSNREKNKCSELSFLPWRPLASNWCAFMQPTINRCNTQHAGCEAFSAVNLYTDAFVSGVHLSTRTNTYVKPSDNLRVVYIYM